MSGRPRLENVPPLDASGGQLATSFHAASSDMPDAPSLSCASGYCVVSMTLRKPYFQPSVGVSLSAGNAAHTAVPASSSPTAAVANRTTRFVASPMKDSP